MLHGFDLVLLNISFGILYTGIDDALAVLYAFLSDCFEILAITTTYGNVPIDMTTKNLHKVLSLLPNSMLGMCRENNLNAFLIFIK